MKNFLIRRWFLIALAILLTIGISQASLLTPLVKIGGLRQGIVFTVLFFMAFPLKATAMWDILRKPSVPFLACVMNYGVLPMFAWAIVSVLAVAFGYGEDMQHGTLVAATTPCTLASAAVWTRRAGGNDAAAIMVTIITNLFCFLITPAWLFLMIGRTPEFDPLTMISRLGLLVVLPMAISQLLRLLPSVGGWATEHKTPMGVLAQFGVLAMIFLGAIQTGSKYASGDRPSLWANVGLMILAVMCIHLVILYIGTFIARLLGMDRRDEIAVGFAGSQKTCMVGLEVSAQLGVTMLPMVAYHVGQLLADTMIADRFRKKSVEARDRQDSSSG